MPADATIVPMRFDAAEMPGRRARRLCREQPEQLPREQPEQPIARSSEPTKRAAAPPPRRFRFRWAMFALLPLALIASAYFEYVTGGQVMSTDDAYVQADQVGISTDISGLVKDIDVTENQNVEGGQVLYRLDPKQFQIAVDNAKANLAQTALTIDSMKQDYRRMLSDVAAQQGQVELDQATYDRFVALVRTDAISKANYDQARFTLELDKSKLESLRRQAQVQLVRLAGNPDIPVSQHPQYLQAQAQVDEAQRELSHTQVNAPFAGIVTSVPSITPGKYLQASTTAFYLVATDHLWVYSNPKETELTYVRPGQSVAVTVDIRIRMWNGTAPLKASVRRRREFSLLLRRRTPAEIG